MTSRRSSATGSPCTDAERRATLAVLDDAHKELIEFVRETPAVVLDWVDPERGMPSYATWKTIRQIAWHIADTACPYYLPAAGLPTRPRADDLLTELADSASHVRHVVETMPPGVRRVPGDGEWTSVKVLRRLAWHTWDEFDVMRFQAARAGGDCGPR